MEKESSNRIVLASTSPYRRALLERIVTEYDCASPRVDETPRPGEAPSALSLRLAAEKASVVSATLPRATVIGADQVAVLGGNAVGKPGTRERAIELLLSARGMPMRFLTSVCVLRESDGERRVHTDVTEVRFRHFGRALAERYVDRDRSWDCAGGFKAEAAGVVLFERVDSQDPTGLIGLPLIWLAATLEDLGLTLL